MRWRDGTFSGRKLLADSKNVHGVYAWRSALITRSKKVKNHEILNFFQLVSLKRLELTSIDAKFAHFWNQGASCN
jgi:hypothetical protein